MSKENQYPTIEDLVGVLKEKGNDALADQLTYAAENSKILHPELIMGSAETGKTAELPMAKIGIGMSSLEKRKQLSNLLEDHELSKKRKMLHLLHNTRSNNWLKRHGYPMRRRPFNERHVILLDEAHLLMNNTLTQNASKSIFPALRNYKTHVTKCVQKLEGYKILEHYKEPEYTFDEIMKIYTERMKTCRKDGVSIHLVNQAPIFVETGKTIGVVKCPAELLIYKKKSNIMRKQP